LYTPIPVKLNAAEMTARMKSGVRYSSKASPVAWY